MNAIRMPLYSNQKQCWFGNHILCDFMESRQSAGECNVWALPRDTHPCKSAAADNRRLREILFLCRNKKALKEFEEMRETAKGEK